MERRDLLRAWPIEIVYYRCAAPSAAQAEEEEGMLCDFVYIAIYAPS